MGHAILKRVQGRTSQKCSECRRSMWMLVDKQDEPTGVVICVKCDVAGDPGPDEGED